MKRYKKEWYLSIETWAGKDVEKVFDTYKEAEEAFDKLLADHGAMYCTLNSREIMNKYGDIWNPREIAGFQVDNDGEVEEW